MKYPKRLKLTSLACMLSVLAQSLLAVSIDDFEARIYDPDSNPGTTNMSHRLFTPQSADPNGDYPLIIYLHGLGSGGTDNIAQMKDHAAGGMFFAEDEQQAEQPSFVLLPQDPPGDDNWHDDSVKPLLMGLIDSILVEFPSIDQDRIYIGGVSRGGLGVWDQLVTQPNKYAAGMAVSGTAGITGASDITHLPLWLFHSAGDGIVPVSASDQRADELRSLGASTIYTRYGAGGHTTGPRACQIPELYTWMMAQRRGEAPQGAPLLRITEYSVGSDLSISGVALDEAVRAERVDWSNSKGGSGQGVLELPLEQLYIDNANPNVIMISTARVLDHNSLSALSQFTLGGTVATPKTAVSFVINQDDSFGSLTFDSDFDATDIPVLSYLVPASNPIQDINGNLLAAFADEPINNQLESNAPSTFINYFQGGIGYYGFTDWPFDEREADIAGFKEYHPVGFDTDLKYPCIIDGHGTGFKLTDPTTLNEGLAKFINNGNEVESPIDGQKFIAICPAGGEWIGVPSLCNLIEYAYNHPNVDRERIYLGGLSGGAMHALRIVGQETHTDQDYDNVDITEFTAKIAGVYSLAGGMFPGYDPAVLISSNKPILVHHGETDNQRKPNNLAGARAAVGQLMIFNCFQGLGHSGTVWDRAWTDGNADTPMVTIVNTPSDPYKSIWEFFDENRNVIAAPTLEVEEASKWSVDNIALSDGEINRINITATGWPYEDDDTGNTTFNQAIDINYSSPSGDTLPPVLLVGSPVHTDFALDTEATSLAFSGTASDDTGVSSVTWQTDRGQSGTAMGTTSWSGTISLELGLNRVYIVVSDAAGNSHTNIFYVTRKEPAVNQAPRVLAGPDLLLSMPNNTADLDASLGDDGLPTAATVQWTQVSGPFDAVVTIADETALDTTVTFPTAGQYILRLTADDGELSDTDDVIVVVESEPIVAAGPTVLALNCGVDEGVEYTATDGTLYVSDWTYRLGGGSWSTSGPISGTTDETLYLTAVNPRASNIWTIDLPNDEYVVTLKMVHPQDTVGERVGDFYIEGQRVLNDVDVAEHVSRLTALDFDFRVKLTDSELNLRFFQETGNPLLCAILVRRAVIPDNRAPSVEAGINQTVLLADGVTLDGLVDDDGAAPGTLTPTISWTRISGPGAVTFGDDSVEDTTATFSATGSYVLQLSATDGEFTTNDTVNITVLASLPIRTVQYDFGTQTTPSGNWNLVNGTGQGSVVSDAIDTDSNTTPFDLRITDAFKGRDGTGETDTGLYPNSATEDSFMVNNSNLGEITFEQLDPSMTYNFTIFASGASDPGVGDYTIGSTMITYDGNANRTQRITFSGIAPDVSGNVVLQCIPKNGEGKAFINVIEMEEFVPSTTNQAPVVSAGADQTVALSVGASLDGTVTDDGMAPGDPTPTTLWSQSSGPAAAFATFTDENAVDTTVSFTVTGTYVLELFATDGDLNSQDSVTITVTDDAPPPVSRTLLFDFGGQVVPTTGNWNLVRFFQTGNVVLDALDTDGNTTSVDLHITDGFRSRDTTGPTAPALYPDNATFDSFYTNKAFLAEITLEELNSAATYDLKIFASATVDASSDGVGIYTVGATSLPLDAAGNMTQTITFTDVQPDFSGVIVLQLLASDAIIGNAFINVLELTEKPGNEAPVATNDSSLVDEGQSVTIDVLANDSDPDSGPSTLSLNSVGLAFNGTTQIVGNQVVYTPIAGFFGADTFSYTIGDGEATASAPVNVTVNDVSLAADLTSAGLTASTIGSGTTGNSRILANGDWEVNGAGVGLNGTADSFVLEGQAVTGDFRVLVNVRDLAGGSDPKAGLVIRELLSAGSRAIAIITDSGTAYQVGSRLSTDGTFTWSPQVETYAYPNAWILLERLGDNIHVAVSSDGVIFVETSVITLSGLAAEVQLGLFSSSGSSGVTTRAVFDGYSFTALNQTTVNIDFGAATRTTPGNWNNMTDFATGSITDLVDSEGWATGIGVSITDAFHSVQEGGIAASTVYPETAQIDSFQLTNANPTASILVSYLDPAKSYDVTFFASRDTTDERSVTFTIDGVSVSQNASGNSDTTVSINNAVPNASGEIVIDISKNAGDWTYLNVMSIEFD